ncbi:asparagine synthetase B family protein [Sutcliffiella rhizosphaerae]|uniref:asparagine synthase (glutamine-hydrolyzing) n=1 Tax=Sutcliffiella rhizosphaerae TaxID=2880967 RepID=A0ABN8A6N2_9BACI|nr:asparagine synthetase B family protein [Sutcliffiella rhizosphaerae]CAG9620750.1 hypothetical protein BACCIP111883_01520 [Sutcliffiella rhizosphaerae]
MIEVKERTKEIQGLHKNIFVLSNSAIYNKDQLIDLLGLKVSKGSILSDENLILLAYQKWGEESPKYFVGDYAFVIYDKQKQKYFGARDFSGSRTLYYIKDKNNVAFSSLIKPLLKLRNYKKKLNYSWLAEFIAIPTLVEAIDMTSTVYEGIYQVPPSHSIVVNKDGKVQLKRYSTINVDHELRLSSNQEYMEAFHEVFSQAVKERLSTSGEVGSHLSGGLDSGAVVSFASKELAKENKILHTFSNVPEHDFVDWTSSYYIPDETPYIKETVKYVGNINDNYLCFPGASPYNEIDDFLDIMEMPYKFFENAFWLKGITEEASKKGITVMLNGARGNHSISWGSMRLNYDYYSKLLKQWKWLKFNKELIHFSEVFNTGRSVMIPFLFKRTFPKVISFKKEETVYEFPSFINPYLAKKTNVYEKLQDAGIYDTSGKISDLNYYRRDYYEQLYPWNKSGVANTKLALRYGVWDRDPTNDIRVINFCLSLPKEQYVLEGYERSLIRRAMQGRLPDTVRLNQQRRGLQGADVIHRMRKEWHCFMEEIERMSKDSMMADLIDTKVIERAFSNIGKSPRPEMIFEDDFKILTRSLILYRFLMKHG